VLVSKQEGDARSYEFLSPTTYEVTYSSLLKNRRRELHTVIGNMIEQDYSERVPDVFEQLAYHFSHSVNKGKGVHYSKLAAEKSYFLYALKESVVFFQQTTDLLGKTDLSTEEMQLQMEVLRRQGFVLKILGDFDNALKSQRRSLRVAVKLGSLDDEAMACNNTAIFYHDMGMMQKALNYWLRARRVAKKAGNTKILIETLNSLGFYYLNTGIFEKASECFQEVAELSEKTENNRMLAFAYRNLGQTAGRQGDLKNALMFYEKALAGFETIGEKESIAQCINDIGMLHLQLGNIDNAMQKFNRVIEIATEIGHKEVESLAHGNIGFIFAQMWQLDRAHEKFSLALTIAQTIGKSRQAMGMMINLGDVHLFRGNLKQALDYHEKAYELAQQIKDPMNQALAQRSLGWDTYYSGDYLKAMQMFGHSQEMFQNSGDRRNGVLSMLGGAATQVRMGNNEQVLGMLQGLETKAREIKDMEILATVLDIKSDCLIALGGYDEAFKVLEELPDLSRKIGNKRLYAWTLAKQAYITVCKGDTEGVQEPLNKSMTLAGEIGDTILYLHNSITSALTAVRQDNHTEGLNTLMKIAEQARSCGAKIYLAKGLWLSAQIFGKLGKPEEQQKYTNEYSNVLNELTSGYDDPQKTMLIKNLETGL
jgi:tetratricopeptide (TPR) repeat protein